MIIIYTSKGSSSCRKAKEWFRNHNIAYYERDLSSETLTVDEIKRILQMTDDGTEDILSTRSNISKKVETEQLTLPLLYELIQQHPDLLRLPIIMDEKRMLAGYHRDEIRKFLPRKIRKFQYWEYERNQA